MPARSRLVRSLMILLLMVCAISAHAELRVSNVFSDHMVLQQQMPIRVWGWADPGDQVSVQLKHGSSGISVGTSRDKDGKWIAVLPTMKADGKAYTLKIISGDESVEFKDVLIGEVWICSGQSNMEWRVKQCANAQEEIAAADHPTIRLFDVPKHIKQNQPQDDAQEASWAVCSPQTVADFSAAGYYFGRALSQELDVPIGLVGTNWGGTRIEPWTPPVGFEKVPELKEYVEQLKQGKYKGGATQIYNGMVAGLTPLSARGVIWYQGESNAGDGLKYDYLKEALVKGWREVFQNDELSFYWVQLADFGRGHSGKPEGGGWGPVREGQRRALRLPDTGMAVIMDIGDAGDIHPKNKQDVGKRLALWALAKDYGKDIVYAGPMYKSHTIKGDKVHIHFDHVGGGLVTGTKGGPHRMDPVKFSDDKSVKAFSLRDAAGNWHWADATIVGDTVVVSSDKVDKPTAVRYAYDSDPDVNFYNKEGLPASPFTTVD